MKKPLPDDFHLWSDQKRKIHAHKKKRFFHERDVFYASLGRNIGCEQNGRGDFFVRPLLVYKKFNDQMFLGIPLSKTHRINRYRYGFSFIEGVHSCALLSQMRVCDARRLLNKIGVVSLSDFKAIQKRTINLLK